MTLECDSYSQEKWTCGLENDMRNLANFHQGTQKSQNWDFHWNLCELKNNSGVIYHGNEE